MLLAMTEAPAPVRYRPGAKSSTESSSPRWDRTVCRCTSAVRQTSAGRRSYPKRNRPAHNCRSHSRPSSRRQTSTGSPSSNPHRNRHCSSCHKRRRHRQIGHDDHPVCVQASRRGAFVSCSGGRPRHNSRRHHRIANSACGTSSSNPRPRPSSTTPKPIRRSVSCVGSFPGRLSVTFPLEISAKTVRHFNSA